MSNNYCAIDAGTLHTSAGPVSPGRLIIDAESGRIIDAGPPSRVPIASAAHRIDASTCLVCPGFIDPHIHGGGGMDVMEGTFQALNTVSSSLARHGTTSFLATTVSTPADRLTAVAGKIGALIGQRFDGAAPLGLHLEGPFINAIQHGAHQPADIVAPDARLLQEWDAASNHTIRLITLAPELEGSTAVIEAAARLGIRVGIGHSDASLEQARAAIGRGACYSVHTFNAMRAFNHREPGIVGAVLSDDRVFAEIIADGVHVDPAVVRFFARAKQAERVLLVTDAISAAGMPDGEYVLGSGSVTVSHGVCRDSAGRLAGSTLTQDVALRNFMEWTGFSLSDALKGLTENPARALGLRGKGVLEAGADADITILDQNFRVVKTFVGGRLVFAGEK